MPVSKRRNGYPVSCNTSDLWGGTLKNWAKQQAIRLDYIQPDTPQQNAYIERYNRTVR